MRLAGIIISGAALHWNPGVLWHKEPAGETSSAAVSHPDQTLSLPANLHSSCPTSPDEPLQYVVWITLTVKNSKQYNPAEGEKKIPYFGEEKLLLLIP